MVIHEEFAAFTTEETISTCNRIIKLLRDTIGDVESCIDEARKIQVAEYDSDYINSYSDDLLSTVDDIYKEVRTLRSKVARYVSDI